VVTHDPQLTGWHLHRIKLAPADRVVLIDVRLVKWLVVDCHPPAAVTAGHRVASHPDNTLDEVLITGRAKAEDALDRPDGAGEKVARRVDQGFRPLKSTSVAVEDDDLTAMDVSESVDELVDQNTVVDQQGPFHRGRRYPERLDEKCFDNQREQKSDQDENG
jgi:hypothetical protein